MAERKSFLLRIDPALWSEIEAWAQSELRSVNGQIEFLLRQAVQKRKHSAAAMDETSADQTAGANAVKATQQQADDLGGEGSDSSKPDAS
jgi:hypothetical protein